MFSRSYISGFIKINVTPLWAFETADGFLANNWLLFVRHPTYIPRDDN